MDMNARSKSDSRLGRCLLVLTIAGTFGAVHAEEADEMAQLTKPSSSISVGGAAASGNEKERARFGQYTGMRDKSGSVLLDFDYRKRDDATGLWTLMEGRNLGLDTREFRFSQQKQGDWKYSFDYDQMVRNSPYTVNTGMLGAGTTTPTFKLLGAPGSGTDLNTKLERKGLGFGLEKWLAPSLQFEATFKEDKKDGSRLWGRGFDCSSTSAPNCAGAPRGAVLFMTEPVDYTTRQFEAKLNYSTPKSLFTMGYYGSFFQNANTSVNPTLSGSLLTPQGGNPSILFPTVPAAFLSAIQTPMSLPADNQAHQVYVSGNYSISPTSKATYKYSYTHATQNEDFGSLAGTGANPPTNASSGGTPPLGRTNAGAILDTTLAQLGMTARPMKNLSVLANLRYESRSDKTPVYQYTNWTPASAVVGTNYPISNKKANAKLEGTYQLPGAYRLTGGLDYEFRDLGAPPTTYPEKALAALRNSTAEIGYRLEVRRAMTETLNGAVGYAHSDRRGSSWMNANYNTVSETTLGTTSIFPSNMMNRSRDKLKWSTDWQATDKLSLQVNFENSNDRYTAPSFAGVHDGSARFLSLDGGYTLTEDWKLTSWYSHGDTIIDQNKAASYTANLRNLSDNIGVGTRGKINEKWNLGADWTYGLERNRYSEGLLALPSATGTSGTAPLPDVTYRQSSLKLFSTYAVQKNADIRFDFIQQRFATNDWTWTNNGVPYIYSDNTTVSQNINQRVNMLKATYVYKWQ
jgi:MtrB/PioB family decaheme-associated outer membrane protein